MEVDRLPVSAFCFALVENERERQDEESVDNESGLGKKSDRRKGGTGGQKMRGGTGGETAISGADESLLHWEDLNVPSYSSRRIAEK